MRVRGEQREEFRVLDCVDAFEANAEPATRPEIQLRSSQQEAGLGQHIGGAVDFAQRRHRFGLSARAECGNSNPTANAMLDSASAALAGIASTTCRISAAR